MNVARWTSSVLMAAAVAAACVAGAGEAAAARGGGGAATPSTAGAPCGAIVVANDGQTVRNPLIMPTVKYTVTSCAGAPLAATVTFIETPGYLSEPCPAPMADPAPVSLPAGGKVVSEAWVGRSSCGLGSAGQIIASPFGRQGHNILLTLTDDATGAVLSTASFSWSDASAKA